MQGGVSSSVRRAPWNETVPLVFHRNFSFPVIFQEIEQQRCATGKPGSISSSFTQIFEKKCQSLQEPHGSEDVEQLIAYWRKTSW